MIPAYNCLPFLEVAIRSVLSQALPAEQMQIEVVDDASTDGDVADLVRRLGEGRVSYYRQPQNVGSLRNFETCINRARGHYVHLLHGDDAVNPGFYAQIQDLFEHHPEAGAAFCRYAYIDEDGKRLYTQPAEKENTGVLDNWLLKIAGRNRIQYAAIVVKREVYEKLGGFYGLEYGEDWEMWVRIAKQYPVAYTPEVLARYRKHQQSITGQKFMSGSFLNDLSAAMQMIQPHLPAPLRRKALDEARRFYALYGARMAHHVWHTTRNRQSAKAVLNRSLQMRKSFPACREALKLHIKLAVQ